MLMIGVSTAQNITNLIPAVQKNSGIKDFLLLETKTAKSLNWSVGLTAVLKQRNINVESFSLEGIDSNIIEIKNKVLERIKSHTKPIMWNLGGGQKPQQIPLWEIFRARNELNIKDIVCYANQDVRDFSLLEFWELDEKNQLRQRPEHIDVDLTVAEIFRVFNYIVKEKTLIYQRGRKVNFDSIDDLMGKKEFRQYLFELPKRFKTENSSEVKYDLELIAQHLKEKPDDIRSSLSERLKNSPFKDLTKLQNIMELSKNICAFLIGNSKNKRGKIIKWLEQPPSIKKIAITDETLRAKLEISGKNGEIDVTPALLEAINPKIKKASDYFETVVIQRVRKLLENSEHKIIEAYANLKTARVGSEETHAAEYDVLCVTNKGTIIALDAKTFDFENKDIDARLYNLEQGSGYYRTFSPVIPLDYDDIDDSNLPQKLIELVFKLVKRRMNFFVLSDSTSGNSFWIKENEDGSIAKSRIKPKEQGWIECKSLENVFK